MTFTVTYRGADGAVRKEAVEAASRAGCLRPCDRRSEFLRFNVAKDIVTEFL